MGNELASPHFKHLIDGEELLQRVPLMLSRFRHPEVRVRAQLCAREPRRMNGRGDETARLLGWGRRPSRLARKEARSRLRVTEQTLERFSDPASPERAVGYDPEKWAPVLGNDHAQPATQSVMTNRREIITPQGERGCGPDRVQSGTNASTRASAGMCGLNSAL